MAFNIWPTPISRSPHGEAHEAHRLWVSNNIQHPCTVHPESIHSASLFPHFVIIIIIIIRYIYIVLFWVLKVLLYGRGESPHPPPVCSHLSIIIEGNQLCSSPAEYHPKSKVWWKQPHAVGLSFSVRDWGTRQSRKKAQCTKIFRLIINDNDSESQTGQKVHLPTGRQP